MGSLFLLDEANTGVGAIEQGGGEAVPRGTSGRETACHLRAFLADELRRGLPTLQVAAARLAMSRRTLHRRLRDDGTSFRDLLEEARRELAEVCLRDRDRSLSEIASLLGFSEQSAFHRAFKRWTGKTPLSYRRSFAAPRAPFPGRERDVENRPIGSGENGLSIGTVGQYTAPNQP
jgi:AraC-like DNA-binding protein